MHRHEEIRRVVQVLVDAVSDGLVFTAAEAAVAV